MNKYRDEIIEIIEDMRARGYTPKETASYLNGYQDEYTYGNREIVGYSCIVTGKQIGRAHV